MFIVQFEYPYEGTDHVGVFETLEEAQAVGEKRLEGETYNYITITEAEMGSVAEGWGATDTWDYSYNHSKRKYIWTHYPKRGDNT